MKKFSIIINCHNGEKFLSDAIESILSQTYKNWEIIFVDNQSTDSSAEIAKSYGDKVIYYRPHTFMELGEARNEAVVLTKGEWIAFLDCDDYWYPEKLEIQLGAVENTEYDFCYAGIKEVDEQDKFIRYEIPREKKGFIIKDLLRQFDVNMVTPIIRKSALTRLQLNFDKKITASEEYNLFIRLAARSKGISLASVLGVYRVSKDSLTNKKIHNWSKERLYTLRQLLLENKELRFSCGKELEEAKARAIYYQARFLIADRQYRKAKKMMSKVSLVSARYFLLSCLIRFPIIWNFIHQGNLKRKIAKLFI